MSHNTLHRDRAIAPTAPHVYHGRCNLCLCELFGAQVDVQRPDLSGGIRHYPCCPACAAVVLAPYDHDRDTNQAYAALWAAMGINMPDTSARRMARSRRVMGS